MQLQRMPQLLDLELSGWRMIESFVDDVDGGDVGRR
jgi:hypothetical protein